MAFSKFFVNGQTGTSENWSLWFGDHFYSYIATGFEVTEDSGLDVEISAGRAYVKDTADGKMFQIISSAAETLTLTDDATNYVFLHCDNGSDWLTDSTSSALPVDGILLAKVTTSSGAITEIVDYRFTNSMRESNLSMYSAGSTASNYGDSAITTTTYVYLPYGAAMVVTCDEVIYTVTTTGSNIASQSTKVEIDIDDGNGYQEVYSDSTLTASKTHQESDIDVSNEEDITKSMTIKITATITPQSGNIATRSITISKVFVNYSVLK